MSVLDKREVMTATALRHVLGTGDGQVQTDARLTAVGAAAGDLGARRSYELRLTAGLVAVYLNLFRRVGDWTPILDDLDDAHVGWQSETMVLLDIVAVDADRRIGCTGRHQMRMRGVNRTGGERFGDRLAGVRCCHLAAPGRSMVQLPEAGKAVRLADTDLWFGSPIRTAVDLAAAAAGDTE